jgi:hypothetical protein
LRWFAAEFLVVLSGVLVALIVNAWWTQRSDIQAERSYLTYLVSDLSEAERNVAHVDSTTRRTDVASAMLERAYYMPVYPPADSLMRWLYVADSYSTVTIPTGTAEALVSTGSLRLIRDDSLRSHITTYLQATRSREAAERHNVDYFSRSSDLVEARVNLTGIQAALGRQSLIDSLARVDSTFVLPPSPRHIPFPFDVRAMMSDRAMFTGITGINWAHANLRAVRSAMKDDARGLREHIQRTIAR